MRTWKILCYSVLILLGCHPAFAAHVPLRADVQGERPQIEILSHDDNAVFLEVRLPGVDILEGTLEGRRWDRLEIPGGGYELDLGAPEVPHFTRLLAIPARSGVRVEFEALETTTLSDIELMPAQGVDPKDLARDPRPVQFDMTAYSKDAFYPAEEVSVGEPAIMRGLRVAPVRMNPVRYNPMTKELRIAHRYTLAVYFEGTDLRNVPPRPMRPISRSWKRLMDRVVMNLDELDLDVEPMGSYLIICKDDVTLLNDLQPLVDWKRRKGHSVVVESFPPGATTTSIKNIIQNAYNNWEIPPEFVLLWGDSSGDLALPAWEYYDIDHPYSQLDGGDILADVAIGRLPAENLYETAVMRNKVLFYEKEPYVAHDHWFHQSVLVAGSSLSGLSTVQTNRWIKTRMIWHEYTQIDTFWYWMGGSPSTVTSNAVNNGVTYYNFRGYIGGGLSNSSINALTNGRKLVFASDITCSSGGFSGDSHMEHWVSVGTPTTPKGAVASVGTATSGTNTRCNNTVDMGLYAGFFDEGITQAGNALNRGKLELYNTYQTNNSSLVTSFSKWNALAGDPGLELFTGPIRYMECETPGTVTWGQNAISLTVMETGIGPLEDAIVCLYKHGELHEVELTDASGQVTLPFNPAGIGNVKLTITKQNFYPIVDSLDVVQADVAVGYFGHSIDDDNLGSSSGDNDGVINPGEVVEIPMVLKNYGSTTTATSVSLTASESDDYAILNDDYETFPNINAGATANSADDLDLTISIDCPHGHVIQLALDTQADQGSWDGVMDLEVVSYDMNIRSTVASGSDSLLSPGETADLLLTVTNDGGKSAASLTATISSLSSFVTVNDNQASFGTVGIGSTTSCTANPFNLTAAQDTPPGQLADLEVVFTSFTGATQTDTITIALGEKTTTDPQGPDEYGYYCFDNTDLNYAQAPTYSWIEIDPDYGGSGTELPLLDSGENNDASVNVPLPFTFRYYGEDTDEITICSNGWISTWANNSFTDFRNYPIPSLVGPNGMIAAFWDDLKFASYDEGRVYVYHDVTDHCFIIEWSRVYNLGWPNPVETFEIVLYDPAYHTTPTGDGPILFQYNQISEVTGIYDDNPYSTVGIERPDQQDGIEIVYWNTYEDPATAQLQNGRAYFFTTALDYSLPGNNLYTTLTPYAPPIVIPAGGGSFDFNIEVGNTSPVGASADVWCDVTLPSGSNYGPTIGPVYGVPFPGNWSTDRDRTQAVPGGAPAGTYTYNAYVGVYPNTVYNQDNFTFEKTGTDGSDDEFQGWYNYGEPFFESYTENPSVIPDNYALHQAYPNPFNPTTTIGFDLPDVAKVMLSVYDISGRQVVKLVDGWRNAGMHEVVFDGSDLASGLYIYHIQMGNFSHTQKLVLLK